MKCWKSAQAGENSDTYSSYMAQNNFDTPTFSGDLNLQSLLSALAYRAKRSVGCETNMSHMVALRLKFR